MVFSSGNKERMCAYAQDAENMPLLSLLVAILLVALRTLASLMI